jgi:hypothetical protein
VPDIDREGLEKAVSAAQQASPARRQNLLRPYLRHIRSARRETPSGVEGTLKPRMLWSQLRLRPPWYMERRPTGYRLGGLSVARSSPGVPPFKSGFIVLPFAANNIQVGFFRHIAWR